MKIRYPDGTPHEKFMSCLDDYIAIATSDKYIEDKHDDMIFKGLHAGITEAEMIVPLIIIDKKEKKENVYE